MPDDSSINGGQRGLPRIDVEFILHTEHRRHTAQELPASGMSVFGITSLLKGKSIILDQLLNDHFEQMDAIIDWAYPEDEDHRRIPLADRLKNTTRSTDSNPPGRRFMRNVAYRTFKALVEYIYTGRIVFGTKNTETAPKSMYRLAEALRMSDLQAKALSAYADQLNKGNVVDEAFSEYTSRYPEVMQVIAKALKGLVSEEAFKEEVSKRIDRMVRGETPHAAEMVRVLIVFA
ncbi:hypothetical protein CYLTODRAFT_420675 [Cylindrobasidium torrendii FP15055 ss-10]|uniref:BTB domain-containing protein n=1 Tax=Cylindrobasidium torrendii FP15055 ss-10 TaxID=1314674 RepID=A0A0D7BIM0_9AGAR|nr:hypothetical protein CYLTODRAFT_420675 [Cylindrobasidium torrendii FP15055 ss-10]